MSKKITPKQRGGNLSFCQNYRSKRLVFIKVLCFF